MLCVFNHNFKIVWKEKNPNHRMYYSETWCKIWTFSSVVRNTTLKQDVKNTGNGGKGEVYGNSVLSVQFFHKLKTKKCQFKKRKCNKNKSVFLFVLYWC